VTTEQLRDFVQIRVQGFVDLRIEQTGSGYHYTPHGRQIEHAGAFCGASVGSHLIATQRSLTPSQAADPYGVVFAYPTFEKAVQMGIQFEVFRVTYRSALSAVHATEVDLERQRGLIISRTLLILAHEIEAFVNLGPARELQMAHESSERNAACRQPGAHSAERLA
jgi:hypothetical protein